MFLKVDWISYIWIYSQLQKKGILFLNKNAKTAFLS